MENVWRDLRFGLRTLVRHPGFTAVAVLTLALGVGATTAVWIVVQAVLLSALPYPEPDRLVLLAGTLTEGSEVDEVPSSYRDFLDWREASESFEALAVYSEPRSFNLLAGGRPEHLLGEMVSAEYFRLLELKAAAGRLIVEDDDVAGAPPVALVSYGLWRRLAGRDRSFVGSSLLLNGQRFEVVGVLPPGFQGLTDKAEIWLPVASAASVISPDYLKRRGIRWLAAAGRLRPGVSIEQAQAEMDGVTAELAQQNPRANLGIGVRLKPVREAWFGNLRFALLTLLGGALFVLLIACTNVAGLLLARAAVRQREISLRAVLGAHRRRLIRQLLSESAILALAGGVLGLLFAHWSTGLLVAASAVDFRSFIELGVGLPVIAVILAVSLLCALGFGLAPAWLASEVDLGTALQEGGRGSAGPGRGRFLGSLVAAEVALALVLLLGAGLMIRGFQRLRSTDLGFRTENLLTLRIDLKGERYADDGIVRQLARQLLERLPHVPGVGAVALAGPGIPTDDWHGYDYVLESRGAPATQQPVVLPYHHVSPGYFATLGIPMLRGRDFLPGEDERSTGAAIVSEAVAQRFWPGQNPIGQRLKPADMTPWLTVVGVVADIRHQGLGSEERPAPDVYLALLQSPPRTPPTLNFLVRQTGASAPGLVPALRREVRAIAPDLAVYDAATMEQRLDRQTARDRFLVLTMSLFALLALVLAAVGIYGVVSFAVAQRRREIGIRMALGALRRDVLRLMVRRGAVLALLGLAVGVPAALALARVLARFLHGVSAADPLVLAATCLVLLGVALAASFIPAWRVTRIEAVEVLRAE